MDERSKEKTEKEKMNDQDQSFTYTGNIGEEEEISIEINQTVSRRALYLAAQIDRLPAGEYNLIIKKHSLKDVPWHAIISKMDRMRVLDLDR